MLRIVLIRKVTSILAEILRIGNSCDGHRRLSLYDASWGIARAHEEMDCRILSVTYNALSPKDRHFLAAMARDVNVSAQAEIARRMGVTSGYASEYKRRLVEQGIIEERSHSQFPA